MERCLSFVLSRAIRREERRCSRSSSVFYAELGTDLLNVPVLADPELLVSGVSEDADVEDGDCFAQRPHLVCRYISVSLTRLIGFRYGSSNSQVELKAGKKGACKRLLRVRCVGVTGLAC